MLNHKLTKAALRKHSTSVMLRGSNSFEQITMASRSFRWSSGSTKVYNGLDGWRRKSKKAVNPFLCIPVCKDAPHQDSLEVGAPHKEQCAAQRSVRLLAILAPIAAQDTSPRIGATEHFFPRPRPRHAFDTNGFVPTTFAKRRTHAHVQENFCDLEKNNEYRET